ncbi:MAG: hypothetical protein OEY23_12710 [Acidimicrobiia bacterium]|nr:hypothetical protein [Acidimicrobiia bacterium]
MVSAALWLHLALVPAGREADAFAVLSKWGFRPRTWSKDHAPGGLCGNYSRHGDLEPDSIEAISVELVRHELTFALHSLPERSATPAGEAATAGWRVVHVAGLGTTAGPADSDGRLLHDNGTIARTFAEMWDRVDL